LTAVTRTQKVNVCTHSDTSVTLKVVWTMSIYHICADSVICDSNQSQSYGSWTQRERVACRRLCSNKSNLVFMMLSPANSADIITFI